MGVLGFISASGEPSEETGQIDCGNWAILAGAGRPGSCFYSKTHLPVLGVDRFVTPGRPSCGLGHALRKHRRAHLLRHPIPRGGPLPRPKRRRHHRAAHQLARRRRIFPRFPDTRPSLGEPRLRAGREPSWRRARPSLHRPQPNRRPHRRDSRGSRPGRRDRFSTPTSTSRWRGKNKSS